MLAFANLHVLTVKGGEVYVHHFWPLAILAYIIFKTSFTTKR